MERNAGEKSDSHARFSEFCKANKVEREKICWRFVGDQKVKISIDKEDACDGGWNLITMGIMFALRELNIDDIDITLRSNNESLDIIIER